MTIPRTTAKKLSTDAEYRRVNESFTPQVCELSEKGLAQRIRRARAARDKYRSHAERQNREARGRIVPRGKRAAAGNSNTVTKQKLFDETLTRFEKQAACMDKEVPEKRESAVGASRKTAKPTGKKAKCGRKFFACHPGRQGGQQSIRSSKESGKRGEISQGHHGFRREKSH